MFNVSGRLTLRPTAAGRPTGSYVIRCLRNVARVSRRAGAPRPRSGPAPLAQSRTHAHHTTKYD